MKTEREINKWKSGVLEYNILGVGSYTNPFVITKVEHFRQISSVLDFMKDNCYFVLGNDIDFKSDFYYENKKNKGKTFYPIGFFSDNQQFNGFFDGKGHILNNFVVTNPFLCNKNNYGTGLFADLNNAYIRNLSINNMEVKGYNNMGTICGNMYKSTVCYCSVINSNFNDLGNSKIKYYGGISGLLVNNSKVSNNDVYVPNSRYNDNVMFDSVTNCTSNNNNCLEYNNVQKVKSYVKK